MTFHILEIEENAEGDILAYLSKKDSDSGYRIAGPKAWGGSRNVARLKISESDLATYIKDYAPELHRSLIETPVCEL